MLFSPKSPKNPRKTCGNHGVPAAAERVVADGEIRLDTSSDAKLPSGIGNGEEANIHVPHPWDTGRRSIQVEGLCGAELESERVLAAQVVEDAEPLVGQVRHGPPERCPELEGGSVEGPAVELRRLDIEARIVGEVDRVGTGVVVLLRESRRRAHEWEKGQEWEGAPELCRDPHCHSLFGRIGRPV